MSRHEPIGCDAGKRECVSASEAARYIEEIATGLSQTANGAELRFLAYLLDMAALEARSVQAARQDREPAQSGRERA